MTYRIKPIEKPKSLLGKLIYFFLKREFGKVITPAKIILRQIPANWVVSKKNL